jgi:hypothetical protein
VVSRTTKRTFYGRSAQQNSNYRTFGITCINRDGRAPGGHGMLLANRHHGAGQLTGTG